MQHYNESYVADVKVNAKRRVFVFASIDQVVIMSENAVEFFSSNKSFLAFVNNSSFRHMYNER